MKIIAITSPKVIHEDVTIIRRLLDNGVYMVHFRKPESSIDECRWVLRQLEKEVREHIIIHDYSELYDEFSLKGIHMNQRVTTYPNGYTGLRTRSCHSLYELEVYKEECDYLFLSPIFDSISKMGYKSGFSHAQLQLASNDGLIDDSVIALGGVTIDKIPYLRNLNFGGVAMSGALYHLDGCKILK